MRFVTDGFGPRLSAAIIFTLGEFVVFVPLFVFAAFIFNIDLFSIPRHLRGILVLRGFFGFFGVVGVWGSV